MALKNVGLTFLSLGKSTSLEGETGGQRSSMGCSHSTGPQDSGTWEEWDKPQGDVSGCGSAVCECVYESVKCVYVCVCVCV